MFRWSCAPSIGLHSALRGKAHGPMNASLLMQRFPKLPEFSKDQPSGKMSRKDVKVYTSAQSCFVLLLDRSTCTKLPASSQILYWNAVVVPSCPEISICLYFWDLLDIFSFYFVPSMGISDFHCSFEARLHFYLMEKLVLAADLISAFTSNKTSRQPFYHFYQ